MLLKSSEFTLDFIFLQDFRSGLIQLRAKRGVGAVGRSDNPKRGLLLLLPRTVPGRDSHARDSPEDPLLHVQRGDALYDDVCADVARLLPSSGFRGENRPGRNGSPRLLCVHVGHRRKDARNIRIHSAARYALFTKLAYFIHLW